MMLERLEFMVYERDKEVNKAIASLETALKTFYNNDGRYEGLEKILKELKEYRRDWL